MQHLDSQIKQTIKSLKKAPLNYIQLTEKLKFKLSFANVHGIGPCWVVGFNNLISVNPDNFHFQERLNNLDDKTKEKFLFRLEEIILTNV